MATVLTTPPVVAKLPPDALTPRPISESASRIAGIARKRRKPVIQRFWRWRGSISTSIG
jgi:hypothetical protein